MRQTKRSVISRQVSEFLILEKIGTTGTFDQAGGMYPHARCIKELELELLKRNRYSREKFTDFVMTIHRFRRRTTWSNDYQLVPVLT